MGCRRITDQRGALGRASERKSAMEVSKVGKWSNWKKYLYINFHTIRPNSMFFFFKCDAHQFRVGKTVAFVVGTVDAPVATFGAHVFVNTALVRVLTSFTNRLPLTLYGVVVSKKSYAHWAAFSALFFGLLLLSKENTENHAVGGWRRVACDFETG